MRKFCLLSGMNWHSSIKYYTKINAAVAKQLAGHQSAQILLDSTDLDNILAMQVAEDWAGNDAPLTAIGQRLVDGDAEAVAIATTFLHR